MRGLTVVVAALFATIARADYCYNDVLTSCAPRGANAGADLASCNAQYSAFRAVSTDLQAYVNSHIEKSYEYLLMATHFGNYQKNREGFHKLFKGLSDEAWENSIELIKYITKRGGTVNFSARRQLGAPDTGLGRADSTYELFELGALARALDTEKAFAEEAHRIHGEVTRKRQEFHDPEVGHYLEKEFMHEQAETIRGLAGHTNDLKRLLQDQPDSSLAIFLFDEFLQKK